MDIVERFKKFASEWRSGSRRTDELYGLHAGTDREVTITITDLEQSAETITTLRASWLATGEAAATHLKEASRLRKRVAVLEGNNAKSAPTAGRAWKAEGTDTPAFKLMALAYQQATGQDAEDGE